MDKRSSASWRVIADLLKINRLVRRPNTLSILLSRCIYCDVWQNGHETWQNALNALHAFFLLLVLFSDCFIDTGERKIIESVKKVRECWHINDSVKINQICKYGSKQIQFDAKGKNAIEVSNGDELLTALESLKLTVEQGELDQQIEATSDALRAGFLK